MAETGEPTHKKGEDVFKSDYLSNRLTTEFMAMLKYKTFSLYLPQVLKLRTLPLNDTIVVSIVND